ncbi:hypothetical protein [Escherichia coli]|nr:hypothetical protein [Escherichia coli]
MIFIASSSREQTTASDGKIGTTGYSGNLAEEAYGTDCNVKYKTLKIPF